MKKRNPWKSVGREFVWESNPPITKHELTSLREAAQCVQKHGNTRAFDDLHKIASRHVNTYGGVSNPPSRYSATIARENARIRRTGAGMRCNPPITQREALVLKNAARNLKIHNQHRQAAVIEGILYRHLDTKGGVVRTLRSNPELATIGAMAALNPGRKRSTKHMRRRKHRRHAKRLTKNQKKFARLRARYGLKGARKHFAKLMFSKRRRKSKRLK